MNQRKATLLIPVELQVRELDSKLLLACIAARRGFQSIIGSRYEMHFYISSFPKSIYLSKSITSGSKNVFRMLKQLGHEIVAWDEEALVHLPPEAYFKRRLSAESIKSVSHLFAWGEDNVELWRKYPEMPPELPIHVTGNPRGDLLRPEMRRLYDHEVKQIRKDYGDFILVNTNFNQVNAFYPDMNLLTPSANPGGAPELSRRAKGMGMSREYAEGLCKHKQAIFEDFQKLIPELDKAFTGYNIVVRPHPAENQDIYNKIAAQCERVSVTNEGNVVPWLMAAKALIHNGCTTGVEAYAIRTPAIAFRASVNEQFDYDFHHLANQLSHQCFAYGELRETLGKILSGEIGAADGDKRNALMNHYLAAQEGPLACDRMVDILEEMIIDLTNSPNPPIRHVLQAWFRGTKRRFKKRFRDNRTDLSHHRPDFLRHRYPGICIHELREKASRFQQVLGYSENLKFEEISSQFYRISR